MTRSALDGGRTSLSSFAVALAVAVTLMFITLLLAAGVLAGEREENAFARLVRGLVSRTGLLAEKAGLAAVCSRAVCLLMLAGLGLFVDLSWGRFPLWLLAVAVAALGFAALGLAIGALAREVRAASLLAFMLALPLAFLALVPSGAVAPGLYDVIRGISAVFPFKPRPRRPGRGAERLGRTGRPAPPPGRAGTGIRRAEPARPAQVRLAASARLGRVRADGSPGRLTSAAWPFRPPACGACARPACCATWCARPSSPLRISLPPMFVQLGEDSARAVEAMPGVERLSISHAVEEAGEAHALGVPAVLLFGVPADKDEQGSGAYDDEGVVQLAVRALKDAHPELVVMTDVCLCAYTSHGHCGVVLDDGSVDNDVSLELLAKTAISHASAGADAVAPSDMMDGRVGALRAQLDAEGCKERPDHRLLGEVRVGVLRAVPRGRRRRRPPFGDRRSYQMDPANADEAVREALLDVERGRGRGHGQAGAALPRRDPAASRRPRACRWPPTT